MSDRKNKRKELLKPYTPPAFYSETEPLVPGGTEAAVVTPKSRVQLARLPTAIEHFCLPEMPEDTALLIKRDDGTSSIEMSGNKIRKLEFLLADAIHQEADAVLTAGGTQSNHARATAAACSRLYQMPCHLLLRKDSEGRNGNFFLDNMFGANIEERELADWISMKQANPKDWLETYGHHISSTRNDRQKVYCVPVGGSNPMGCWGYLNAVDEITQQFQDTRGSEFSSAVSDVVVTSGSGGTLAGLSLGLKKYAAANKVTPVNITSYGVCDDNHYFYDQLQELVPQITRDKSIQVKELCNCVCAKGLGYAKSTREELEFVARFSRENGILLDPTYTGKAMFKLWQQLKGGVLKPERQLLFVHTGGATSLFDKAPEIATTWNQ